MCGTSNKGVDLAHALYLRILGTKPLKKIFLRPCIANAFKKFYFQIILRLMTTPSCQQISLLRCFKPKLNYLNNLFDFVKD